MVRNIASRTIDNFCFGQQHDGLLTIEKHRCLWPRWKLTSGPWIVSHQLSCSNYFHEEGDLFSQSVPLAIEESHSRREPMAKRQQKSDHGFAYAFQGRKNRYMGSQWNLSLIYPIQFYILVLHQKCWWGGLNETPTWPRKQWNPPMAKRPENPITGFREVATSCLTLIKMGKNVNEIQDSTNYNDRTYSCPRNCRLSASLGPIKGPWNPSYKTALR